MSKQVRLTEPLVRDNGRLRPASWDEALETIRQRCLELAPAPDLEG